MSAVSSQLSRQGFARRVGASLVLVGVASALFPAVTKAAAANAAGPCRTSVAITAPSTAPIQATIHVTANVKGCKSTEFDGDCRLERQSGTSFVAINAGPGSAQGECDFPVSSNTNGKQAFRVRFTGDQYHSGSVSRVFGVTFNTPTAKGGAMRLGLAFVDATVVGQRCSSGPV